MREWRFPLRAQGGIVVEDFGPVLEHAISGDRDGAAFISLADDLEQQVGTGLVDGEIAEFVEDQKTRSEVAAEVAFELPGGLGGGESVDGVDGAGEQHRVAALARLQAQCGDQMGLAEPDPADEHDVGGLVD